MLQNLTFFIKSFWYRLWHNIFLMSDIYINAFTTLFFRIEYWTTRGRRALRHIKHFNWGTHPTGEKLLPTESRLCGPGHKINLICCPDYSSGCWFLISCQNYFVSWCRVTGRHFGYIGNPSNAIYFFVTFFLSPEFQFLICFQSSKVFTNRYIIEIHSQQYSCHV